jgi:hypothetical protein
LEAKIAGHLERLPNIKHGVEVVPLALTRALIDACHARNYRFFILTRKNEERRLLSLYIALSTGAWGPKQAEENDPKIIAGERAARPVRLEGVADRVTQDAAALGRILSMLRVRRIDHDWLVYEQLYESRASIEHYAREIAASLGIEIAADDPRLGILATSQTRQGSAEIADYVSNPA